MDQKQLQHNITSELESLTHEELKQIEELEDRTINPLIRIADAIEEILRLVKKDMEPRDKNKK